MFILVLRSSQLDVLKHLGTNKKILNETKAANQVIRQEEVEVAKKKKAGESKRYGEEKICKFVVICRCCCCAL